MCCCTDGIVLLSDFCVAVTLDCIHQRWYMNIYNQVNGDSSSFTQIDDGPVIPSTVLLIKWIGSVNNSIFLACSIQLHELLPFIMDIW